MTQQPPPKKRKAPLALIVPLSAVLLILGAVLFRSLVVSKERTLNRPDNAINIDNPSDKTFYVTVDGATYKVLPHVFLDGIPVYGRYLREKHRIVVKDSAQRVLADTVSMLNQYYHVVNPSRSVYAFWNMHYDSDGNFTQTGYTKQSVRIRGREFADDVRLDSGLILNNTDFNTSMDEIWFHRTRAAYNSSSLTSVLHHLMRADDFVAWQDFLAGNSNQDEKTALHDRLAEWCNLVSTHKPPYSWSTQAAINAVRARTTDEASVARLAEETRGENGAECDRLLDRVVSALAMLEVADLVEAAADSPEGEPTLSPMITVSFSYRSKESLLGVSYFSVISRVEQYNPATHAMEDTRVAEYPEGRRVKIP